MNNTELKTEADLLIREYGLPELLAGLAEYRLLFFGALMLIVLWIAPDGIVGAIARLIRRNTTPMPSAKSPTKG